ncbi:SAM-dependent methyltransferase [Mycolicibacterium confluentis]|nr:SAM-dependent methyltransferase [Mycolicibacterium confluentis]MCV7320893.1 SAM-dependent methyltransferase [Mycolicibacterium confluentis]
MVRDSDDRWEVDESVGATALGAAAVRAYESAAGSPLFVDPYAQRFLDAAAERGMTVTHGGRMPEDFSDSDPALVEFVQTMTNYAATRTKCFDDFVVNAAVAGVRQFVILAAGLDTRAWRLDALRGCSVFEIDQPEVLRFKEAALGPKVVPVAYDTSVPIDLRGDWPKALRAAGFQQSDPTAWSAEGLLPYLPPEAQGSLFDRIDGLSASGSRLIVDVYRPEFYGDAALEQAFEQLDRAARSGLEADGDDGRIYQKDLFFTGERIDVSAWLRERGWEVSVLPSVDAMAALGRPAAASVSADALSSDFVEAKRLD